jgi:hypothetical protein
MSSRIPNKNSKFKATLRSETLLETGQSSRAAPLRNTWLGQLHVVVLSDPYIDSLKMNLRETVWVVGSNPAWPILAIRVLQGPKTRAAQTESDLKVPRISNSPEKANFDSCYS